MKLVAECLCVFFKTESRETQWRSNGVRPAAHFHQSCLVFSGRNVWMDYTAGCYSDFPIRLHFVFTLI